MDALRDAWQSDVDALWQQGQRQQAIDLLLSRINAMAPPLPQRMGLQLVYYVFLHGDLVGAERFLRDLAATYPQEAEIVENLAVVLSRQGKHAEALPWFERSAELRPESANVWDGLANCRASLADADGAREAGERSLAMKDAAAQPLPEWTLPEGSPAAFLAQRPEHHVVSFSLWGDNPRYLRGALRNLLLVPEIYPGWTARFYADASVPAGFLEQVRGLGGEVVLEAPGQGLRQKLCWRFQVANDPAVGRFLVRDCDAVVSIRERHAVEQWLASDLWFHVMRDWWTHTDLVLAGLWGGIAGVLPPLAPLLAAYRPPAKETANVDQWFLRDVLWDALRRSALIHDRCYRSGGSQPWPDPPPAGNRHVGQDEWAARRGWQEAWLSPWLERCSWLQGPGAAGAQARAVRSPG